MQSWDDLVSDMSRNGYVTLVWVEVTHGPCGDFRGAVADVADFLPCPKCAQPAEAAILGRGLTRTPKIPWLCISPALPASAKAAESYDGTSGYVKVIDRRRCQKFWDRARAELAGIR